MKTSELITKLEQSLNDNGDLSVFFIDDGANVEVKTIALTDAGKGLVVEHSQSTHVDLPQRITLE